MMEKRKRGVSVVVGYVLLITFGVIMAGIVYTYLKTYVPSEIESCPDGASIFLKNYTCTGNQLTINLKNNGKFNLSAYFIYGGNTSDAKLATVDLSKYYNKDLSGGLNGTGAVYFYFGQTLNNTFGPTDERVQVFDLENPIYSLEITPARFQKSASSVKFVSCGDSRIKEVITCTP